MGNSCCGQKKSCSTQETEKAPDAKDPVITKDITIDELFARYPQRAEKFSQVFSSYGLSCAGCSSATWETLETAAIKYGMNETKLYSLIQELIAIQDSPLDVTKITLTSKAASKFKEIALSLNKEGAALRFDEQPKGCSGFEYILDFSEGFNDDEDTVLYSEGIEIHVYNRSLRRLLGCEIDYVDGFKSGFKISNPNVRTSCGCGTSHGY